MKPVVIRVYPQQGESRLYVRALVWPTRKAMLHYLRAQVGPRHGRTRVFERVQAICSELHVFQHQGGRWRKSGLIAEISLYRGRIGTEIISHEMLHATFAWARRRRIDTGCIILDDSVDVEPEEEAICEAHGSMVRQFVNRAYALGLYESGKAYA